LDHNCNNVNIKIINLKNKAYVPLFNFLDLLSPNFLVLDEISIDLKDKRDSIRKKKRIANLNTDQPPKARTNY
jgi:hypothetical protein